jgi:predicted PurR-regulated permease PerM
MRARERGGDEPVAFAPQQLSGLFAAPRWLRDLGRSAWLAVGVTLFVVAVIWLLSLTYTIVAPLIAAAVVAAVASPLVGWLERRGLARGLGAALLLVVVLVLAAGVVVLLLAGVASQFDDVRAELSAARETLGRWLADLGVAGDTADRATRDVSTTVSDAVPALLQGLARGVESLSSLVFFLALTALSLFFLLKDGHAIRLWSERQLPVPPRVAHQMTGRVLQSLRGYFFGVTLVAAFNALVVGAGALLLDVPLPGTIAAVTFLGAYVPYLGAWGAGAFSVLVALGGAGTDAAAGMIVVQLLANGLLQQLVQPIAYGAALGIHPLAVLVATIAGGSLFGAVGLILAAPLTAAAARIAEDLSRNRADGPGNGTGDTSEPAEAAVP